MVTGSTREFENLGKPVLKAGVMNAIVGPDENGEMTKLYLNFSQNGAPFFVVQIDVSTGEARQFGAPLGRYPWGLCAGPDGKIYASSCAEDGGFIFVLDPANLDEGLKCLGKPAESETYIWRLMADPKRKLVYGCTYGNGKLVGYNTETGEMIDYGRLTETEQYSRPFVLGANGWVYTAVGTVNIDVIAFNPDTHERRSVRAPERVGTALSASSYGWAPMYQGADGHAYFLDGGEWFRLLDGNAQPVTDDERAEEFVQPLADGRIFVGADLIGTYTLRDPKTGEETVSEFEYVGDGCAPFVIGAGPDGNIYGSTALPLLMWKTDVKTGEHTVLGNPTPVGGELYTLLSMGDLLYVCAYTGSYLSVYDPSRPFEFGTEADSNPRGLGFMGDGHLRPRAMIAGPNGDIYVGSLPPYGEHGGAMGVYSPSEDRITENYRNLVENQGISALAWDAESNLIFGGTDINGGGGTNPIETEARFFIWDPTAKEKIEDLVLVAGDGSIASTAVAGEKVFILSRPSNTLSVYSIAERKIIDQKIVEGGAAVDISLEQHTDGMLYGLTRTSVLRIDPATHEVTQLADYPDGINCGWAMTEDGIYFGSNVYVVRYNWQNA